MHNHHIVPRYMGGSNAPNNLVKLSTADHAEAHRLLWVFHGKKQDYVAWKVLIGQMTHQEAWIETCRIGGYKAKGRKCPKDLNWRKKLAEAQRGKKQGPETIEKKRIASLGNKSMTGLQHSEESRRKMSETHKARGTGQRVGFKHSEETKAKMRATHLARYRKEAV